MPYFPPFKHRKGREAGLKIAIRIMLKDKFGTESLDCFPQFERTSNLAVLERFVGEVQRADTVEQLRQWWNFNCVRSPERD